MNIFHVRYDLATGEIVGFENTVIPMDFPGTAHMPVIVPDGSHFAPDATKHRVDLVTLEIVDKHVDEQAAANVPKIEEIQHAIAAELSNTDQYVVSDRPMTRPKRAAWKAYRQALRDLSKLPSVTDMLAAWPMRPDGTDTAAHLKSRIA